VTHLSSCLITRFHGHRQAPCPPPTRPPRSQRARTGTWCSAGGRGRRKLDHRSTSRRRAGATRWPPTVAAAWARPRTRTSHSAATPPPSHCRTAATWRGKKTEQAVEARRQGGKASCAEARQQTRQQGNKARSGKRLGAVCPRCLRCLRCLAAPGERPVSLRREPLLIPLLDFFLDSLRVARSGRARLADPCGEAKGADGGKGVPARRKRGRRVLVQEGAADHALRDEVLRDLDGSTQTLKR